MLCCIMAAASSIGRRVEDEGAVRCAALRSLGRLVLHLDLLVEEEGFADVLDFWDCAF